MDAPTAALTASRTVARARLAAGRFDAAGRGALAESGTLVLESGDLSLAGAQHRVSGAASFSADLGGAIAIDLTGANLRIGGGFEKPTGVALRLSGMRLQRDRGPVLRELSRKIV